jgi:hypothetical protein
VSYTENKIQWQHSRRGLLAPCSEIPWLSCLQPPHYGCSKTIQ